MPALFSPAGHGRTVFLSNGHSNSKGPGGPPRLAALRAWHQSLAVSLTHILYKAITNTRRSQPLNNATAFGIVRADFNLHSVADCEAYVMNLKLPCGLGQYAMPAV
jgi:hypothetical protein